MPRTRRHAPGRIVYHVLNRGNAQDRIFEDDGDFLSFEKVLAQAHDRVDTRLLSYCIMPNHWHLVLWPRRDGDLTAFMYWLTLTHTTRWHAHRHSVGTGHLYQGRYKSFPVETDDHYLAVCRYVERNALRANLVDRAEKWRWSSMWRRANPKQGTPPDAPLLYDWPVDRPRNWVSRVNQSESQAELESIRLSVKRGRPYGPQSWQKRMAKRMGLESTFRDRGRPRKKAK